jgi:Rap1a immunity proteins
MRRILKCVSYFALTVFSTSAQCEYKTAEFFKDCTIASRVASGQTNVTTASLPNAMHCLGYVEAAALSMRKAHELYGFAFPSLTKSLLGNDKQLGQRYFAAALLSGLDVCIPDGTTVQTLTMLIVNHLNANPKDLSSSPIDIANRAWFDAFPCEIPP